MQWIAVKTVFLARMRHSAKRHLLWAQLDSNCYRDMDLWVKDQSLVWTLIHLSMSWKKKLMKLGKSCNSVKRKFKFWIKNVKQYLKWLIVKLMILISIWQKKSTIWKNWLIRHKANKKLRIQDSNINVNKWRKLQMN